MCEQSKETDRKYILFLGKEFCFWQVYQDMECDFGEIQGILNLQQSKSGPKRYKTPMKRHPNNNKTHRSQIIIGPVIKNQPKIMSQFKYDDKRGSVCSTNVIGPHVDMPTYKPLNFQTQQTQNDQTISTKIIDGTSSVVMNLPTTVMGPPALTSPVIMDESKFNFTIKPIIIGIIEMMITKERKRTIQNSNNLKKILVQEKIKVLVRNFITKLHRNNVNSKPIDFTPFFNDKELSFLDTQGIQINYYFQIAFFICSIVLILTLSILCSLSLVFQDVESSIAFNICESICLIYFSFQIIINLITVKFQQGKRLGTIRQILWYNIHKNLYTDILSIIILFIDLFVDNTHIQFTYLRIPIILKLTQVNQKIQKLQIFFIRNFYYQQYWDLIKVFLFNFSLAHILAIALIAMASIDPDESWMTRKDIMEVPWYQKYVWAYYWATTIMLTVGFGDLTATNYEEAIVVTLIETISCIALAYNINRVGMLISNIRSQDLEKSKNFKIFYALSRKNDLSEDLEWRINNYIEESSNIKKNFNYEEENHFVGKLPQGLKAEFLKESNKKIFKNLPFFRHLTERTVFAFAQKIQMHISHPEQIIQHIDDPHNLLILKGGQVGFTCKKPGCKFNSTVIDQLKILNIANPILISLGFIKKPRLNYEIKSLAYSVLYFLDYESILALLKGSHMDYELYCLLKDKAQTMPDEFQLLNCELCKEKHTKFTCPKLHFIPFNQHITNRYIYKVKHGKNQRDYEGRFPKSQKVAQMKALKVYKDNLQIASQCQNRTFESSKFDLMELSRTQSSHVKRRFEDLEEGAPNNNLVKEISDIKDYFSKNTVELIKYEMTKVLNLGESHDEVWIVESDKMKNYKNYFENDNSCNLEEKFSEAKRAKPVLSGTSLRKSTKIGMKDTRRNGERHEERII